MFVTWSRRVACFLLVAVVVLLPGLALATHSDPKPDTVNSWYMDTVNETTLYNMGCTFGDKIEAGNAPLDPLVTLAYGRPVKIDSTTWGADLPGIAGTFSTSRIRSATQEYFRGIWTCLPSSMRSSVHVRIAIGVNNDFPTSWGTTVAGNHGDAWATMVENANSWAASNGYATIGNFVAGGDIELGFSSPGMARAWVDGYKNGPGGWFMFDFGAAAGCQDFDNEGPAACGTPTFPAWGSNDVYYVSYGSGQSKAHPEIYLENGIQAEQWVMISKWAVDNGNPKVDFGGPLTQFGACNSDPTRQQECESQSTENTATAGWNQMVNKMDAKPSTIEDMFYSSDIDWH